MSGKESNLSKFMLILVGAVLGSFLSLFSSMYILDKTESNNTKLEYLSQLNASITEVFRGNIITWQQESKYLKKAVARVKILIPDYRDDINELTREIDCLSHMAFREPSHVEYINTRCKGVQEYSEDFLKEKEDELITMLNILL
jgi:hypothetical protein